jgi:hypothetical protein
MEKVLRNTAAANPCRLLVVVVDLDREQPAAAATDRILNCPDRIAVGASLEYRPDVRRGIAVPVLVPICECHVAAASAAERHISPAGSRGLDVVARKTVFAWPVCCGNWFAAWLLALIPLSLRKLSAGDHNWWWVPLIVQLVMNGPQLTVVVVELLRRPRCLVVALFPVVKLHLGEVEGEKEDDPAQDELDLAQFPHEFL